MVAAKRLMVGCVDSDGTDLVARLLKAGLWEEQEGGYLLTDFLPANRSRAQVEADRAQKAEAGRRGGRVKAEKDRQARG
jgi:hypothetical protein